MNVRTILTTVFGLLGLGATRAGAQNPAPAPATQGATGRIAGRVIDAGTSKPLTSARVMIVGQTGVTETDLDGRFRTGPVPVGLRAVRVALIGYKLAQIDSVHVKDGETAVITVALTQAAIQLQEISVAADAPTKTSSSAGLLAQQQSAAAVTDGLSAESITKTPDSDAGAAMVRVTGLSVVDNKVVVRGLSERYSTSLLNGVEIASPEPDKKFVPLDAFSANLLESIVATKTATPDKPGDFAGGTVDIQTKEFPENFVLSFGVSQSWNSRSTFERFARGPRSFRDRLGFDGRHRGIKPSSDPERFAEGLSNIWTPRPQLASPNTGADVSLGGRKDLGSDVFGYVFSVSYTAEREFNPDRLNSEGVSPIIFQDNSDRVDWSGIANFAYRLGAAHKIGFKNFYSRGSEELFRQGLGADQGIDGRGRYYQGRFLERYIAQSQLTGDHYLTGLLRSRINWKASYGQAGRDDFDNRQLQYVEELDRGFVISTAQPSRRFDNSLRDKSYSGQLDWSAPFTLTSAQGGELKVGGSFRRKDRSFRAEAYELHIGDAFPVDLHALPPEELLAPENLGPAGITYVPSGGAFNPYVAREDVEAAYGMVDMDLIKGLRLVGGVRVERWKADLTDNPGPLGTSQAYRTTDILWSGNLTWIVSNQTNLRFAAYKTVARPDLRELSPTGYNEVVGGLEVIGNRDLVPASILNGDVRFEIYPGPGELFAVSAFYKRFRDPIVTTFVLAGDLFARPDNLDRATSIGAEFEARKNLGFIHHGLRGFALGGNLTLIRSRVVYPSDFLLTSDPNLTFQGQSPYIINGSLGYGSESGRFSATVLFNRFGRRIVRYGLPSSPTSTLIPPNVVEEPRSTLDAKVKAGLWRGLSLSLTGKNLLDSRWILRYDHVPEGQTSLLGRSIAGISFSMGLSYAY